jgi:hypothetical protein
VGIIVLEWDLLLSKILFQRKTVPFFSYFFFRILFMVQNKGTKLTIQITRKRSKKFTIGKTNLPLLYI